MIANLFSPARASACSLFVIKMYNNVDHELNVLTNSSAIFSSPATERLILCARSWNGIVFSRRRHRQCLQWMRSGSGLWTILEFCTYRRVRRRWGARGSGSRLRPWRGGRAARGDLSAFGSARVRAGSLVRAANSESTVFPPNRVRLVNG